MSNKVLIATIPLDVYGHADVKIIREIEDFHFPEDERLMFAQNYKFNVGSSRISTRLIFMSEPYTENGITYYNGVFHPVSLRYFRIFSKKWKKLSQANIGALKDELGSQGWAINLPV